MTRRYLPAGTDALLVELADLAHTLDLLAALQAAPPPGVTECVPAARTLLVRFDPRQISAPALRAAIEALKTRRRTDTPARASKSRCATTAPTWPSSRRCWASRPPS